MSFVFLSFCLFLSLFLYTSVFFVYLLAFVSFFLCICLTACLYISISLSLPVSPPPLSPALHGLSSYSIIFPRLFSSFLALVLGWPCCSFSLCLSWIPGTQELRLLQLAEAPDNFDVLPCSWNMAEGTACCAHITWASLTVQS